MFYITHTIKLCQSLPPALGLAIARDGSSGGVIRLAIIEQQGVERVTLTGSQIPQFYQD